jgi:low molecular weight protein-tyrosine phosphatase
MRESIRTEASPVYKLLFLCTGNYYRSRFAELLFNAMAATHALPWQAFSRGLALDKGVNNIGPMSPLAIDALYALGIASVEAERFPLQVEECDLQAADHIIALQEAEHKLYLQERYPAWTNKVEYWHIRDVVPMPTYNPLEEIAHDVQRLIAHFCGA